MTSREFQTGPDPAKAKYRQERSEHWDAYSTSPERWVGWWGRYYHKQLARVYRSLVAPGQRVLELGCAHGDLLAVLEPAMGVGVDFSQEMIRAAATRHPRLRFIHADAHDLPLDEKFDVIILAELVNDLWDVETVLREVARLSTPRTRIILSFYNRLWQLPVGLGQRLGLARRTLPFNWLTPQDIANMLYLADLEVLRRWTEVLMPLPLPPLSGLLNRYLVKLWPFRSAGLANFMIARPAPRGQGAAGFPEYGPEEPSVSVVVPARNEAGNLAAILDRVPDMGAGTEIVIVEGGSTDGTFAAAEQAMAARPERRCKLLRQTGKGKADAVRLGFAESTGQILMILDADLTVPPEDLPRFYEALRSGKAELVNGVRLVYPMADRAMRFLNLVANKFFCSAFSWVLGQPIKDTLCGTKALWKADYERIAANRSYFGDFDQWGDFDLLFGAARLSLKIVDMPIRYRERTYGTTNIVHRWKHGWLLLRMLAFAARRLKFV